MIEQALVGAGRFPSDLVVVTGVVEGWTGPAAAAAAAEGRT